MKRPVLLLVGAGTLVLAACGRGDISANVVPQPTSVLSVPTDAPDTADTSGEVVNTAADGGAASALTGNAENGEALFNTMLETSSGSWMCASCHSTADARLVGPGLGGLNTRADTRVEGEDAVTYVHQSIVDPNAFLAPGDPAYPENLMPQNYGEVLTEDQINDLIAYVLSL